MDLKSQMDAIYRDVAPERIPWNSATPPAALVEFVESGRVAPCHTVDLGCGAGNYAVWLALRGFQVTGIDLSPVALGMAERLAAEKGVGCRWLALDLTRPLETDALTAGFDFAFDWEVLHHVFPEDRPVFAANVWRMLRPGGHYLSVCFSERDRTFEGEGRYRQTRLGTRLYFSAEDEVRALVEPLFRIESLETVQVEGKTGPHIVIRTIMTRSAA